LNNDPNKVDNLICIFIFSNKTLIQQNEPEHNRMNQNITE